MNTCPRGPDHCMMTPCQRVTARHRRVAETRNVRFVNLWRLVTTDDSPTSPLGARVSKIMTQEIEYTAWCP